MTIVGDFNAKTLLAFKNWCYDGTNVVPDGDCNNNETHLETILYEQPTLDSLNILSLPK